jgi:hypothetical protein
MPVDLKLRAEQFWGYLTLILGCLLSIVQFFALISLRRLDLRVFFLLVMLAAYLIRIGLRSIRLTRQREAGRQAVTFADDLRAFRAKCYDLLSVVATKLTRPGITRTTVLVVFGVVHVIAGLGAFLFVGTVLFAVAGYLGIGPAAVPVLLFCLFGAAFGIAMIVRPDGGAHRAAAVWDIVLGIFLALAAMAGYRFYMERFILAAILLGLAGVLMLPDMLHKREPSNTR